MGQDLEKRPGRIERLLTKLAKNKAVQVGVAGTTGLAASVGGVDLAPQAIVEAVKTSPSEVAMHLEQSGISSFSESAVSRETLEANSDRIAGNTYTTDANGTVNEFWVLEKRGGSEYSLIKGDSIVSVSTFDPQKEKYSKFQQFIFWPESNGQLRSIAKNGDNILVSGMNMQTGASILNLYNGDRIIDLSGGENIRQYRKVTSIQGSDMFLGDINSIIRINSEPSASQVLTIDFKWKDRRITWDQTQDPSSPYTFTVLPLNIETNEFEVLEMSGSNASGINYYKINSDTGAATAENIPLTTTSRPIRCAGVAFYKDSSLKTHAITASLNEKKIYDIDLSTENREAISIDYRASLPNENTEIMALRALTLENGKSYILIGGRSKIEGSSPPRYKQIVGSLDLETNTFDWKEFSVNVNYAYLSTQDYMQAVRLPNNQHALTYDIFGLGRAIIPINPDGKADVSNIVYVALSYKTPVISRRAFIPLLNR